MLDHNTEVKNKFFNPGGCLRSELLDHMVIQRCKCLPQFVGLFESNNEREYVWLGLVKSFIWRTAPGKILAL